MKSFTVILITLLALPMSLAAQRTQLFGKFIDQNGNLIEGTSMERGYERQLVIDGFSITNATMVTLKIPNSVAVNAFQSIVDSKIALKSGQIAVLKLEADRKVIFQKILMTDLKVLSVTTKDDGVTLELKADTLEQMFYETDKNGQLKEVRN
ncbi:hypothetical protein [Flagellimonas amoyensis]|uniref:hypothetical protein n=1 Tax=Flagellimonas amoyensis TaxID=2169401 RepID=UPI00131F3F37|nr:hypothetical protein [Allomuricauda amoyensis]